MSTAGSQSQRNRTLSFASTIHHWIHFPDRAPKKSQKITKNKRSRFQHHLPRALQVVRSVCKRGAIRSWRSARTSGSTNASQWNDGHKPGSCPCCRSEWCSIHSRPGVPRSSTDDSTCLERSSVEASRGRDRRIVTGARPDSTLCRSVGPSVGTRVDRNRPTSHGTSAAPPTSETKGGEQYGEKSAYRSVSSCFSIPEHTGIA